MKVYELSKSLGSDDDCLQGCVSVEDKASSIRDNRLPPLGDDPPPRQHGNSEVKRAVEKNNGSSHAPTQENMDKFPHEKTGHMLGKRSARPLRGERNRTIIR